MKLKFNITVSLYSDSLREGEHNVDVLNCDSDDDDVEGSDSARLRDSNERLSGDLRSPHRRDTFTPERESSPELRNKEDDGQGRSTASPTQRPRIWSLDDVLGPTRSSSPPGHSTSEHSPSAPAFTTSTLPFPMPLKPTATSHFPVGLSQHTAASLRHWAERSPYPIPSHHYAGLSAGLMSSAGGMHMRPTAGIPSFPGHPGMQHPALSSSAGAVHPGLHQGAGAASMASHLSHPPVGLLTTQGASPLKPNGEAPHLHRPGLPPMRNGFGKYFKLSENIKPMPSEI